MVAHFIPIILPVQITIASDPTGLQIEVDGTPVVTPQIFSWNPGETHQLNAPSPQTGGTGIQYVYNSWSNGGSQSQTITVTSSDSTFTAFYDTEYELITSVDPPGSGTINITPNQSWFINGSEVVLEAVPTSNFAFSSWSGDLTGTENPDTLVMDGPKNVVAQFNPSGLPSDFANQIPEEFILHQNYPNPFNPETHIIYGLPYTSEVSLELYDITGKRLQTFLVGRQTAGYHSITWRPQNFSSGVYLLKFQGEGFVNFKKMILIR